MQLWRKLLKCQKMGQFCYDAATQKQSRNMYKRQGKTPSDKVRCESPVASHPREWPMPFDSSIFFQFQTLSIRFCAMAKRAMRY